MRRFLVFAVKVIAFQVTTYFLAGTIAYPLLTKQFYVGPHAVFVVFMRTEAGPELFRHAVRWFIPAEFLRGLLVAGVLYPLFDTLKSWRFRKRFLVIASLYVVLGFWAATVAAPGTIEGMVYMRPFITPYVHLAVQPEIIGQGLALGLLIAGAMTESQAGRVLRQDGI